MCNGYGGLSLQAKITSSLIKNKGQWEIRVVVRFYASLSYISCKVVQLKSLSNGWEIQWRRW